MFTYFLSLINETSFSTYTYTYNINYISSDSSYNHVEKAYN